ncbi:MAG TPA: MFS transporter [Sphingomonas sp.]|nr:MFS transporter [Sphingomonas sp.]
MVEMQMDPRAVPPYPPAANALERAGISPALAVGYLGLLIFMIGDGVESAYLSRFLVDRGNGVEQVALLFTAYGLSASVAAWFSGALSDLIGPRRVMIAGLAIWIAAQLGFLLLGVGANSYAGMLLFYAVRGLAYPLFAFGFLVWITRVTVRERLSSAAGWFWFAFTGGLPTLGALVASMLLPVVGPLATLWVALGVVIAGGATALLGTAQTPLGGPSAEAAHEHPIATLLTSLTLAYTRPRVAVAAAVRAINTASQFGFLLFLPIYFTQTLGFDLTFWLRLVTVIFTTNIFCNLAFGLIGDRMGWRRTVAICGGVGTAISTLAMYYVPTFFGPDGAPWVIAAGAFYGATLAGYVPLTALTPWLAPERRGAAMSLLNLGAGVSVWLGPAVVGLLLAPIGAVGVMWTFALLHLLSAGLAMTLTTSDAR